MAARTRGPATRRGAWKGLPWGGLSKEPRRRLQDDDALNAMTPSTRVQKPRGLFGDDRDPLVDALGVRAEVQDADAEREPAAQERPGEEHTPACIDAVEQLARQLVLAGFLGDAPERHERELRRGDDLQAGDRVQRLAH